MPTLEIDFPKTEEVMLRKYREHFYRRILQFSWGLNNNVENFRGLLIYFLLFEQRPKMKPGI